MWPFVFVVAFYASVTLLLFICFFFFQAEDGIRDLVRSRGLGDVYKRQLPPLRCRPFAAVADPLGTHRLQREELLVTLGHVAVSYTHLTLPTSDLV